MRLRSKRNWGDHSERWVRIDSALSTNTPGWAIISAWSILEDECNAEFGNRLLRTGQGRTSSICEKTAAKLSLSRSERDNLNRAARNRNKVAHGRSVDVTWSDVDVLLDAAYRLHLS
jgi:hypothetical protein